MDEDARSSHRSQRSLDKSILQYLRQQIARCRQLGHREARWYYQAGFEFAATLVYGPLPARPDYTLPGSNLLAGQERHPQQVETQTPEGWRDLFPQRFRRYPLRKIVKRFSVPWRGDVHSYETLECAHIVLMPAGYSVPAESRRCVHCAIASALAKKKTARAGGTAAKSKAVGA